MKFTSELWSSVIFGHRWSLVTGEVSGDLLGTAEVWPPVKFWWTVGHRWSLDTGEATGDLFVTGKVWSLVKLTVIFWSLVTFSGDLLVTGEVWTPMKTGEVWSPMKSGNWCTLITGEVWLTYFSRWRCWWWGEHALGKFTSGLDYHQQTSRSSILNPIYSR